MTMLRNIPGPAALLVIMLMVSTAAAAPGDAAWARFINNETVATADGLGGVVIAAGFYQPVDFGAGTLAPVTFGDLAIVRYDADGAVTWQRHVIPDADGYLTANAMASDTTGAVYVGGTLWSGSVDFGGGPLVGMSEGFLVKFDAAGDHVWSRLVGNLEFVTLATAGDRLAVIGNNNQTTDLGGGPMPTPGSANICAGVLDLAGNHLWSAQWGNTLQQWALGGGIDAAGNLTVAGTVTGAVDFGGGDLTAVNVDLALASYDAAGNHRWSQLFAGTFGYFYITGDCAVAPDGRSAITGWFTGDVDFGGGIMTGGERDVFVAVHDTDGAYVWARGMGGASNDAGQSVSIDAEGVVAVSGLFEGPVDFGGGDLTGPGGNDLFLATYDAAGDHLGSWAYGSADYDDMISVDQTPSGDLAIWGFAAGGADFGFGPSASWGPYVALIAGPDSGGGGGEVAVGDTPLLVTGASGYPNPFNPNATIAYTVAQAADVSVRAYDARGRLVGELVPPRRHEAGDYAVTFRPGASGVYLVRVRAGGEEQVVKMVAVK
jgi:hypothetical protein